MNQNTSRPSAMETGCRMTHTMTAHMTLFCPFTVLFSEVNLFTCDTEVHVFEMKVSLSNYCGKLSTAVYT